MIFIVLRMSLHIYVCDGFSKNYLINRKLTGYPQQINLKNIAYFSRLTWVMMDTWVDLTPRNLFHELYNLIVDMKNRLQLCCRISSHTLPAAWTQFFKKENKINFLNIRILLCNSDHFSSHLHFVTTRWCKIESFVLLFPIFHPSHMQEVLTIYIYAFSSSKFLCQLHSQSVFTSKWFISLRYSVRDFCNILLCNMKICKLNEETDVDLVCTKNRMQIRICRYHSLYSVIAFRLSSTKILKIKKSNQHCKSRMNFIGFCYNYIGELSYNI